MASTQAALKNGKGGVSLSGTSYDTMLPVIKKFCNKNGATLKKELLDFSAVFGDVYKYNNLDDVLAKMEGDNAMAEAVGIAMTGKAVSVLCQDLGFKACNFHGTTSKTNSLEFTYKNAIYGLGKTGAKGNYRFGLLHWVYVDAAGNIMSWGDFKTKSDIEAQGYDKITHYLPALT